MSLGNVYMKYVACHPSFDGTNRRTFAEVKKMLIELTADITGHEQVQSSLATKRTSKLARGFR